MNGLGEALAWLSIAVTLVTGAALILERIAALEGPRAGSWVGAVSVMVIITLTPLALCPIPTFMTGRWPGLLVRSEQDALEGSAAEAALVRNDRPIVAGSAQPHAVAVPRLSLQSLSRQLRSGLAWGAHSITHRRKGLPTVWCVLLLVGMSCCLLRLLIGLWGVYDCRRKSVAIVDPDLFALTETLRIELGVGVPIDVRELPDTFCRSAAALGWRRPLVLLPESWRNWSDAERRAVLAHELAHIARADFAAVVAARLGLALHFYHPLVHWMVARLVLQQELAADALAARLAGGRRVYLLALSGLALKTHKGPLVWPASTFLPRNGHLIRRIHMLRDTSSTKDGALTRSRTRPDRCSAGRRQCCRGGTEAPFGGSCGPVAASRGKAGVGGGAARRASAAGTGLRSDKIARLRRGPTGGSVPAHRHEGIIQRCKRDDRQVRANCRASTGIDRSGDRRDVPEARRPGQGPAGNVHARRRDGQVGR